MGLHGRDCELARLAALIDDARGGRSCALLVHGEAGAGKSALLEEAATLAHDLRVLRATALETEQELPFGVLHQLLRPALPLLERLPDPQARALRVVFGVEQGAAPDRFLGSVAVLSLVGELAEERPLLAVVDDLQWADAASADALVFVARRLEAEGIALLFAARDGEGRSFEGSGLPALLPRPIEADAAGRLLAEHSGEPVAAEVAERLAAETGGNALALAELGAELRHDQLSGAAPLPAPLPLGGGIARAYAARLHRLPQQTQTAMLVAALQGDGPLAPVLDAARKLRVDSGAFDPAEQAGLVTLAEGRLRFRHPLLRSTVHATAPLGARRAAHRALADAVSGDPDRRAWHLAAAAVGPDPHVVEELGAVAERARVRGAHATASDALERAADLIADREHRTRTLAQAAQDAWLGGNGERAGILIDRARELHPPEPLARALGRLQGTVDAWCGRPASGCATLCREADAIASDDPRLALELLAEAAEAASFTGDRSIGVQVGEVAERVALPADDRRALLLHRLLLGTHHYASGRVAQAAPLLREAVAIGRELDDPVALNWAGRAAVYLGDETNSLALDRHADELAREAGAIFTLPSILVRTAITELWLGRLVAAETTGTEAVRLAAATGQEDLVACGLAVLAYNSALRGRDDACRSQAEEALEIAGRRGLGLFADIARTATAHLALVHGQAERAVALLEPMDHPGVTLFTMSDRVEAAVQAGRADLAASWASAAQDWAEASGAKVAQAVALHCAALVADPDQAAALLAAALECHTAIDRPFERARTELALGQLLRRRRRRADARDQLQAALAGFERLGAERWAERAHAELRATGQTARRRDPTTLDDLTPQEIQVGRLVAQGLTNREVAAQLFLSPRTIDFHLRNLFRKLGVTARTQLAQLPLDGQSASTAPEHRAPAAGAT